MEFLSTGSGLLLIFIGFCVLIVVHELGHYVAAKWAGIRVDGFAIGMGPPLVSWRRGIGWRLGSTHPAVVAKLGRRALAATEDDLARAGIGETEWSFRAFPLGGYVKMLGQEDGNPEAVSDHPRSYQSCSVGKRMVVVSAGVVANLVLAVVLFLIAFLFGVRFPAPVIGDTLAQGPAARAVAVNAAAAGLPANAEPGLQPGDRIESIDGEETRSFLDAVIAAAMGRLDEPLDIVVRRPGVDTPLRFEITPERDKRSGLLSIGIGSASSTTITQERDSRDVVAQLLADTGLAGAQVRSGMRLSEADGTPISTYQELAAIINRGAGRELPTVWTGPDGARAEAMLVVEPLYEAFRVPAPGGKENAEDSELGLAGLTPLLTVRRVSPESANADILRPGDAILRAGSIDAPTLSEFTRELALHRRGTIDLVLLRDGRDERVSAEVDRNGRLGFSPSLGWDLPYVARVIEQVAADGQGTLAPTPVSGLDLFRRSRLEAVNGTPVHDWRSFRAALQQAIKEADPAADRGEVIEIPVTFGLPVGGTSETKNLRFTPKDAEKIAELEWTTPVAGVFDPEFVTLQATGPLEAIAMGLRETKKMALQVYLTIDRLMRRTVGVDQLHGPVGIFHVGTRVADQGFMYLVFFLAAISVNLAVMNFLPLPIVDGGLFLFLVYEKFRGRPPSIAFQNAATAVGLVLIASLFLVTFYNDLARLIG